MPTYKSFFDLPALSQPALGSSNGPMNPTGIIPLRGAADTVPLAGGPGMVPLNGQTPYAVSPLGAPSSPMGSNPPAMLQRPAADADLTKHYWKAAGSVLAGTGNQEHASAIMDLIKPPISSSSSLPVQGSDPLNSAPGNLNSSAGWKGLHAGDFSIPSTLPALSPSNGPALSSSNGPQRESWGTGLRGDFPAPLNLNSRLAPGSPAPAMPAPSFGGPGATDAPDTGLRTIILKQAAGQPLNNAEFRRLATRQSVEDSSSSQLPVQGSDPSNSRLASGRSIESLMGRTARPLLDSSRPGETAVDRLLKMSQAQSAIEDRSSQADLRRNTLARDNAKDAGAAAVAKAQGAFAQSGQPLTFDNAIKAGLPLEVADKYPKEKEGGFATAAEAQAAIPAGSKGQVQQAANGKWTVQFQTAAPTTATGFATAQEAQAAIPAGTRGTVKQGKEGRWAAQWTTTEDEEQPLKVGEYLISSSIRALYPDYAAYRKAFTDEQRKFREAFKSAEEVRAAVQAGKLDRAAGLKILESQFQSHFTQFKMN